MKFKEVICTAHTELEIFWHWDLSAAFNTVLIADWKNWNVKLCIRADQHDMWSSLILNPLASLAFLPASLYTTTFQGSHSLSIFIRIKLLVLSS